jgi:hypothetical protein
MNPPIFSQTVETFVPMLNTLAQLLEKGGAYAGAKKFEPEVLVRARLAPDMYPLYKQVQITCDLASNAVALLTGGTAVQAEHGEESLAELKGRISKTIDALRSLTAAAFEGAEARVLRIPLQNERVLECSGMLFVRDWILPNFYFHIVTAYNILRHNGVELGKRDYLSHVGIYIKNRDATK